MEFEGLHSVGVCRTGGGQPEPDDTPQETLDKFLAKHTSEDNANFAEILDTTNQKRVEKLESRGMGDRPPDSVTFISVSLIFHLSYLALCCSAIDSAQPFIKALQDCYIGAIPFVLD